MIDLFLSIRLSHQVLISHDNFLICFLYKQNSLASFIDKINEIQNINEKQIFKKKLLFKKKIKEFTLFNHYKILNSILLKNEN